MLKIRLPARHMLQCAVPLIVFVASLLVPCSCQADPAAVADSTPYRWRSVDIIAGGFIDGLIFNPAAPEVLYARTDIGGAYRWDAAAGAWRPMLDWVAPKDWNLTGVESVGIDPVDPRTVYLAVGTYTKPWASNGAIMRSSDGGRTFRRTDLPIQMGGNEDGRSAGERLAVDPAHHNVLYFGSRNNGLWKSSDFGASWSQVATFPVTGETNGIGVVFVVFPHTDGQAASPAGAVYAGVSQEGPALYRSTDSGATWAALPGQPAGLLPHQAVLTRAGFLYVTYGDAPGPNGMSAGAVWKYDTHAGLWTDISPVKTGNPGASGYAGLAVDRQHPDTVMVSTMDRWSAGDTLFRSRDGGAIWADIGPKTVRDWSLTPYMTFGGASASLGWWLGSLAIDPFHSGHVLYGTGATIWASQDVTESDSGLPTHWTIGAAGIEETAVVDLLSPPSGPHLISGLGDIGGFRHDDLTVSPVRGMWTNPRFNTTDGLDFAELDPQVVVRVGSGAPGQEGAYSLDGAVTWAPFPTRPPGAKGSGSIAVSSDGAAMLWAPRGGDPSISHDHGAAWTACTGAPAGMHAVADRVNPAKFYGRTRDAFFVSTDGGATFTAAANGLPGGDGRLRAVPGHEGDLWLTQDGAEYHSTDSGQTFTRMTTLDSARALGFGKPAPGSAYPALYLLGTVAGQPGIFRSDNTGASWTRINDADHQYATADIIIGDPRIYGRVYVGCNGRGILYGDPAPLKKPS